MLTHTLQPSLAGPDGGCLGGGGKQDRRCYAGCIKSLTPLTRALLRVILRPEPLAALLYLQQAWAILFKHQKRGGRRGGAKNYLQDGGEFPARMLEDLGVTTGELGQRKAGSLPYVALIGRIVIMFLSAWIFHL